jgi:hypothetical protein
MLVGVNNAYLLGLFGSASGSPSLDLATLAVGASSAGLTSSAYNANKPVAPSAPWIHSETPAQASAAVQSALAGHSIVDVSAPKLDLPGASDDYRKLFALYQGVNTLSDLANRAQTKNLAALDQAQLARAFSNGAAEIEQHVDSATFLNCGWRSGLIRLRQ